MAEVEVTATESTESGQSATYDTLLGQGISPEISSKLDKIHSDGLIAVDDLDDRAIEALKEFSNEDAIHVLDQFTKSDLSHVQNKSAFLCGVMKTYRAKMKTAKEAPESAAPATSADTATTAGQDKKGPNEEKVKELLDRTGYTLDITTGQRKYGGPPPAWEGPTPGTGEKKFCSQIFIGKLPRDMYEDELVPLFEPHGTIYDLRIMVDALSGLNKGFAFCTFTTKEGAQAAVKAMDKKEVRGGRKLGVCLSQANNRLFVGSIPKSRTKKQIFDEFVVHFEQLTDVIVYISSEDKAKNRGFAFLEFSSHKDASLARRRLMSGRIQVFGNITPTVDWADPIYEPDEEVMAKVKVVYVRNLSPAIDDTKLTELFKQYGTVEKVKKIKDYAFIHFLERENAVRAIEELDGQELDDLKIEVSLAKPQVDKKESRRGMSGFGSLNQGGRGGRFGEGFSGRGRGGFRGGFQGNYNEGYGYQQGFQQGYQQGYGYEDASYDNYYGGPPQRGRGRGGPPRGAGMGRGGPPRGGPAGRGGPMLRGAPGGRGGLAPRGRGVPRGAARGANRGAPAGGNMLKRRGDFKEEYGTQKRKFGAGGGDGWGTQPIAQQPLNTNNYYSDDYGSGQQEWYSDSSYGQQWN